MADSNIRIAIDTVDTLTKCVAGNRNAALQELADFFRGIRTGSKRARSIDIWKGGTDPINAFGTAVCSAVDVSDAIALNGVTITAAAAQDIAALEFDQSGTDIACGTSLAAVINGTSNALIQYLVEASNYVGTIALSNASAAGYIRVVTNLGKWTLVPGTDFSVSGTDTQDGDALVVALHAISGFAREAFAINTAGTVRVYQRRGASATVGLAGVGTTGVTVTQVAATARVGISSLIPGTTGNTQTITTTDVTDLAVSGARLTGGTGGNVTKVTFAL